MQSKGGATPPPARPGTPGSRPVVRAPGAAPGTPASPRPIVVPPPVPGQPPMPVMRSRSDIDAEHRARVQAKVQAEGQARARAQAEAQARARAQVEARARAQAEAQARARAQVTARVKAEAKSQATTQATTQAQRARGTAVKPGATALQRATVRAGGEEFAALQSRDRVAQSLAKVQAAERRVADAMPGHAHAGPHAPTTQSLSQNIRSLFRDRKRIREAFILAEVLGPARGNPAAPSGPFAVR